MLRNFLQLRRQYVHKAGMPGLNRLTKEFKDVDDIMDDPEGFGDIESDFMQAHKSHKQYEREMLKRRDQVRHFIVGNKYFKTKQPNFLTYAEKEQIRLLNQRDPDEWNADKLAESFPATSETISKIIKAKWIADDAKRIERHDKNVINNWEMFKKRQFTQLDAALETHLNKFAKRSVKDLKNLTATVRPRPELPKPTHTEFSSIVTESMKFRKLPLPPDPAAHDNSTTTSSNCENPIRAIDKTQQQTQSQLSASHGPAQMDDETYLLEKIDDKRHIRFQDLIRKKSEVQQNLRDVTAHHIKNPQGTGLLASADRTSQTVEKLQVTEVDILPHDMISISNGIRDKIHIPKHLWRKGHTYRLSDCYYDDDGEFLYRVPGMTGRNVK